MRSMMIDTRRHGKRSDPRKMKARDKVIALVNEFNALSMPFFFIGVDDDGLVILTQVGDRRDERGKLMLGTGARGNGIPLGVMADADRCLTMLGDGTFIVTKDRQAGVGPTLTDAYNEKISDILRTASEQ